LVDDRIEGHGDSNLGLEGELKLEANADAVFSYSVSRQDSEQ
jgi:hypothetical protein